MPRDMANDMESETLDLNIGPATDKLCSSFLLLLLNKLSQMQWLKQYNTFILPFWNSKVQLDLTGPKSGVGTAAFHLEALRENLFPCPFWLLEATLILWPLPPSSESTSPSQTGISLLSLFCLPFLFLRTLTIALSPCG